jgi:serine O-acetyltransferase
MVSELTAEHPAPPPLPWVDPAPGRPIPLRAALGADIVAHIPPQQRPRSRLGWCLAALPIIVRSSGFHAVFAYRLAHTLRARGGWPGRAASAILFWLIRHLYACSLAPTARLHGGLMLPHPQGLVIGPGAVVGPRAWIFHNVTLGGVPGRAGLPCVGSDARIYAGAVLVGPITLGDNVFVGANAVIHRDVPARSMVRAAPADVSPLPPALYAEPEP